MIDHKQLAIDRAHALVSDAGGRRWLQGTIPDSYDSEHNRVTVQVLEGSPVRGVVVSYSNISFFLDAHGRAEVFSGQQ